jgi:lysozyme
MTNILQGIDVSYAQGLIDWDQVANSKLIDFAFCKASEAVHTDPQFKRNWEAIKAHGLIRGAYHFARLNIDPVVEANYFVEVVGSLDPTHMLVLDVEAASVSGVQFTDWNIAWLETVEKKTGTTPIVYTGGPFFNSHGGSLNADTVQRLSHFPLWLAAYTVDPKKYIPTIWKGLGWKFWQRSGDTAAAGDTPLQVPGIHGNVDRDNFVGTLDDLRTFALNLHPPADNAIGEAGKIITNSFGLIS